MANSLKERALQDSIEKYLNLKKIVYVHIPDDVYRLIFGNKTTKNIGAKSRVSKAIKSVPDLMIFKKDGEYNKSLLIELKTPKGKLSQGQIEFKENLNVFVLRDFDSVIKEIERFLDG